VFGDSTRHNLGSHRQSEQSQRWHIRHGGAAEPASQVPGDAVNEAFIGLGGQSVAPLVPNHQNLLATRTLSKAHSLAGFRVGYAVLPESLADDLNAHNDAYPLARASQAAALATLRHEEKIRDRVRQLREWTEELAAGLRALGVRTFPTSTYFFLADFSAIRAIDLANRLRERQILIKPLQDRRLGQGYLRVTTALPEENAGSWTRWSRS
jgi:histidinol-phosphate aminotransferase